jgi:hypothetical protein
LPQEGQEVTVTSDTIGAELLEFLARHVHSVAPLEILCLLAEDPARTWSKTEVFKPLARPAPAPPQ